MKVKPTMSEQIQILGLKELENTLRKIAPMIKGNPLRTAARAMTVPMIEKAQELVYTNPETDSNLANTIDKKLIPVSERDAATAKGNSVEVFEVGPRRRKSSKKGSGWYAHFVEFGIPSGRGAQPARPFMRPAFEMTKQPMIDAFTGKLSKSLELARKRLVKQGKL